MRIEQLEYVAAVHHIGSLRRASEQLHISQPALSEAISKLEKELGVTLLDRRRSGARISRAGRDLLPYIAAALTSIDQLRVAAGDQKAASKLVRLGTVNTATAQLLIPSLTSLQGDHPATVVEVLDMMQPEIQVGLEEGTLDLGLANMLDGDELPVTVQGTPLLRGRPVVVLPSGHPYAERAEVSAEDLRREPFVAMRTGYLMSRFAQRLFGDRPPLSSRSTDGAEMGKLMVAEGMGLTVLPDFSVVDDPLERSGHVVVRPIAGDATRVTLALLQRRGAQLPEPAQQLAATFVAHARRWTQERAAAHA